jgi:hypothetical protein
MIWITTVLHWTAWSCKWYSCPIFRCQVQILIQRPAILIFLSFFLISLAGQCLKLGHDLFLPHPWCRSNLIFRQNQKNSRKKVKKVKFSLCCQDVWGSGCIDPQFLDLGTSWKWGVSFKPRPLYPRGKARRIVTIKILISLFTQQKMV